MYLHLVYLTICLHCGSFINYSTDTSDFPNKIIKHECPYCHKKTDFNLSQIIITSKDGKNTLKCVLE